MELRLAGGCRVVATYKAAGWELSFEGLRWFRNKSLQTRTTILQQAAEEFRGELSQVVEEGRVAALAVALMDGYDPEASPSPETLKSWYDRLVED